MNPFLPAFEGEMRIGAFPGDFVRRIQDRVENGFFVPGRRVRSNYGVRCASRDEIAFGAQDLLTAYAIGLNEVRVWRVDAQTLRYQVSFWRWTWLAIAHSSVIAFVLVVLFLVLPQLRAEIAHHAYGAPVFFAIALIFPLVWPWILIAVHRKFAEQALRSVVREAMREKGPSGAMKMPRQPALPGPASTPPGSFSP